MDDEKTVWCGNLSDKVTEELLFELFLQAAPLERVRIPTDKEGRKSNFGFVTFKHQQSVEYAVQLLNGIRLYDKNLNIKPRNPNSNTANRFPEKSFNNDSSYKSGNLSQPVKYPSRDDRCTPKSFRDNYRDDRHRNNSYSRYDSNRDRHDSNRRKQNYDRRDNFKHRGRDRRGNRKENQ
ncbi:RNA-binding protein 7 isoform X1 [Diorhabda carinulata]|uniref:RNA-binding protein 7 isoform X1 n=1 Tax=Diorhabda carinulata TaxID=1163345 RepID=UPI0025A194FD|nr:RNA-binding protein 7 isoform X1 [Diorhabda carinulata]